MDVIARGADQSRTKMVWFAEDEPGELIMLIIRDGNRALAYSSEDETSYTLMEAAGEHPENFARESSPLDPDSDLLMQACPSPKSAGARTILGR